MGIGLIVGVPPTNDEIERIKILFGLAGIDTGKYRALA
jgi:hypothetical protein